MRRNRKFNNSLYESIIKNISKGMKKLNENIDLNKQCTVSYVESSTDGYVLTGNVETFKNYNASKNYIFDKIFDPYFTFSQTVYDYITDTEFTSIDKSELDPSDPNDLQTLKTMYDKLIKNPCHKDICIGVFNSKIKI